MTPRLTEEQQRLVEAHQTIPKFAVYQHIYMNDRLRSEEEDLLQTGYLALCEAALVYDSSKAKFKTFAEVVVSRRLIQYCRNAKAPTLLSLDATLDNGSECTLYDVVPSKWGSQGYETVEVQDMLARCGAGLHGVARKGLTALRLRFLGYEGGDVAVLYHVPPNHVSAWVSRARKQLQRQREEAV